MGCNAPCTGSLGVYPSSNCFIAPSGELSPFPRRRSAHCSTVFFFRFKATSISGMLLQSFVSIEIAPTTRQGSPDAMHQSDWCCSKAAPCFIQPSAFHLGNQVRPQRSFWSTRPKHCNFNSLGSRRSLLYRHVQPQCCADTAEFAPLSVPSETTTTPSYETPLRSISIVRICEGLWGFSRPHTIYGTFLSVTSVSILALQSTSTFRLIPFFYAFLTALAPALLLNVYIVGLNQLYDVDIDTINKPYLPLPAGIMTKRDAAATIAVSLVGGLSFCFAPLSTAALRTVLIGSTILGTLYSMPPFRLKRFALLASIAILSVRGVLINIGFFLHAATAVGVRGLPPLVVFATWFFMVFGVVIALLKDAPDIRGDRTYGIRTFSVQLGARAVFNICATTLVSLFSIAAVYYFFVSKSLLGGALAALMHLLVAAILGKRALEVDTETSSEIYKYYMMSWKAFYLEYLLLPIATL